MLGIPHGKAGRRRPAAQSGRSTGRVRGPLGRFARRALLVVAGIIRRTTGKGAVARLSGRAHGARLAAGQRLVTEPGGAGRSPDDPTMTKPQAPPRRIGAAPALAFNLLLVFLAVLAVLALRDFT